MNRCDVIMGVVIIKFLFKCAQRVILLVCKVSLSFHISFFSYRGGGGTKWGRDSIRTPKGFERQKSPEVIGLNYIEHLLSLASAVTGCVWVSAFALLVGIPIDITCSAVGI